MTAIVTLTDDGGPGRLRRELEMPPPGDIRECLVALAEDESFMGRLFRHRFDRGELAGHAFGNIFLAALTEVVGSFDAAVASRARARRRGHGRAGHDAIPRRSWPRWRTAAYVAGETAVARRPPRRAPALPDPADAVANPPALAAMRAAPT